VGSDSNVLIDLAQELRSLEYSQRLGSNAAARRGRSWRIRRSILR
jgi:hypothetical protein